MLTRRPAALAVLALFAIAAGPGNGFITVASNTDLVEEYDPAADSWGGLKARMPTPRSGGAWATVGGRIYAAGGEVATPEMVGAFRAVEAYDPGNNSWRSLPAMPMPRHGVAGAVLGNRLHLVSGMVTSAAVGATQDSHLEVHASSHDVLDLGPA